MVQVKNRYEALSNETTEEVCEVQSLKDKLVVDEFLNNKLQPTGTELKSWTKDIEEYFKRQRAIDRSKE